MSAAHIGLDIPSQERVFLFSIHLHDKTSIDLCFEGRSSHDKSLIAYDLVCIPHPLLLFVQTLPDLDTEQMLSFEIIMGNKCYGLFKQICIHYITYNHISKQIFSPTLYYTIGHYKAAGISL